MLRPRNPRQHREEVLDGAQLPDLPHLLEEVLERELRPGHLLGGFLSLLLIHLLLGLLDERHDVAHTEDPRGHAVGIERFEVRHLLPRACEEDGPTGGVRDGKRGPAARVAVQLREDEPGHVDLLHEGTRLDNGILAGHRVARHEDVVRTHRLLHPASLSHHVGIHVQAARRVHDHDVPSLSDRLLHRGLRDLLRPIAFGDHRDADLTAEREQLLDRCRTLQVRCDQERLPSLLLQVKRQLRAMRGLSRPLDAGHHDDHRVRTGQLEGRVLASQRSRQLVANHLDDLLGRREAAHDLVRERPFPNPPQEVVDNVESGIGLEERRADIGEGRIHLFRMELAPRPELAEDPVQAVGERVEHEVWRSERPYATRERPLYERRR